MFTGVLCHQVLAYGAVKKTLTIRENVFLLVTVSRHIASFRVVRKLWDVPTHFNTYIKPEILWDHCFYALYISIYLLPLYCN